MKLRQYLLGILIACAAAHFIPAFGPASHVALPTDTLLAQNVGYVGWSNMHMAYVHADFTDISATGLQNIPDLTFVLPANSTPYKIDCDLYFSQATNVADNFGIQFSKSTNNAMVSGLAFTNATTIASGAVTAIGDQNAHIVLTFTPAVATILYAHVSGFMEQLASGSPSDGVVNISVGQATAADLIVVRRGSACVYHSMN